MNEQNKDTTSKESLLPPSLDDILGNLVAAFPSGCFCPPSPLTITQIENA
ncbi:hypothetical protein [Bacillus cereus]|nr:hypothetical protein [Bacillus cereus]